MRRGSGSILRVQQTEFPRGFDWDVSERDINNARRMGLLSAETEKSKNIANLRCQRSYQKTGEKEEVILGGLQQEMHMNGIILCLLAVRRVFIAYTPFSWSQ